MRITRRCRSRRSETRTWLTLRTASTLQAAKSWWLCSTWSSSSSSSWSWSEIICLNWFGRTNTFPQTFLSDVYNVQLQDTVVNIRIPKLCKQVLSILLVTHFKGCHITMVRVYYVGEIYNTNDPRRQQSKLEPKLGRYFRNVWEKILAETVFCG